MASLQPGAGFTFVAHASVRHGIQSGRPGKESLLCIGFSRWCMNLISHSQRTALAINTSSATDKWCDSRGRLEKSKKTWNEFLATTEADSIEFLGLSYLIRFQEEGGVLMPGYLLSVYPPFVAKECVNPSVRPIPSLELRLWLADFARQIRGVEDGQRIQIRITQ